MTLKQLVTRWLKVVKVAESSAETYRFATEHMIEAGGSQRVQAMTAIDLDDLFIDIQEGGAGIGTRQLCVTIMSQLLDYAKDLDILTEKRRDELKAKLKRPKSARPIIIPFDYDETKAILSAAEPDRLYGAIVVSFVLGTRQGETFGLRWMDIDWKAGTVSIQRQVIVVKKKVVVKEPKTKAGRRTLPMPEVVREALHRRRQDAIVEKLAKPDDYVFPLLNGNPITRSFHLTYWKGLLKRCGLKYRGLHHARHTCATQLLDCGTALQVVTSILGHSSVTVTLTLYGHLLPRADKDAIAGLEKRLGYSAVTAQAKSS